MAETNEIESMEIEVAEMGRRSLRSWFRALSSGFRNNNEEEEEDGDGDGDVHVEGDELLQWAEIERLPTVKRLRASLFDGNAVDNGDGDKAGKRVIDVRKLGAGERHEFIEKLINHIQLDNLRLLRKIRRRIDRIGVELPTVEVRFKNLHVEAECEVVHGKPLPTLWNSAKSTLSDLTKLLGSKTNRAKINILNDVGGIIKPGRLTLLIGPPGCGKTTLLKALSGGLDKSLQVTGEVSYNGYRLEEFVPQKTSAYVSQNDLHIPQMTVRETLDFSARCQGVGPREEVMFEVIRKEKEAGIVPDPYVDTYMKATSIKGLKRPLHTDYVLKILGLDICSETLVGDDMKRGISGGQKKRLTTGEMIIGPVKALFMDEITNGLDSSTTFQIVSCLQHLAHITDATMLVSILQPAPETFELFDDIIMMAEGKIVYHGPRDSVLEFFEDCGFRCPERKGVADFLQEVISKKDQAQYWHRTEQDYSYFSVDMFSRKFKESPLGNKMDEELLVPFEKSRSHKNALSFSAYSVSKWEIFRASVSRELLLMKRHSFVYVFRTSQIAFTAFITMTLFWHTRTSNKDAANANYYMGALFFALNLILLDGLPEASMTVARLAHFYKQKELFFYPAWAYAIPTTILKVPLSFIEALVWTSITYYVIGYSHEVWRFFRQFFILFALHVTSMSMFRFLASVFQTLVASLSAAALVMFFSLLLGGFIIVRPSMPSWLKWGFWISPISYGEIGLSLNEFLAPQWQKILPTNTTIGKETIERRGLNFEEYFYWISILALFGFTLIFNIGFTLSLTFFNGSRSSRAIISHEKLSKMEKGDSERVEEMSSNSPSSNNESNKGSMVLPFEPLTLAFQDVSYCVDTPGVMKKEGFVQRKLQLLADVTGALTPGVLTALMGVSGAGKTTLLDVLAGRKTTGYIEGEIRIGGYPKVQETFARISGYCEQTDIHSPLITIEESLIFSAYLRLAPQIDEKAKAKFVNQVLETIELDGIKDALVGIPGVSGLSTEQRKRLTIGVELVANPSIIFMDEPTTGLDARAAAIVMRAVRNVVDTGRTIVCTIHQPSIDIFEAFDVLILLKRGGQLIYSGPLGEHSSKVIEYFEGVPGVPKIKRKENPAAWMLEVTSAFSESKLGVDFAEIYRDSTLYESNKELVRLLSTPPPGSRDLYFPTRYSQNGWTQFKFCLWKQHLSYWRNPSYNLSRTLRIFFASLLVGILYWHKGKDINNQQDVLNVLGSIYASIIFFGVNNCSLIIPYVATERTVMYRERYAGMYSTWAYALAQVAIEVPYIFIQALMFMVSAYPMIGYPGSVYKVFWYFYALFCSLLFYVNLGMLLVSLTPNAMVATILSSGFFKLFNLFAGLLIPQPQIPKWWIWMYYLIPTSWTLNGLLTSQFGDINKNISVFGETKSVASFLKDYLGYHHDHLAITALVLLAFPLVVAFLFAYFIGCLNFQRR